LQLRCFVRGIDIKFSLEKEIYGKKSFNASFFSRIAIIRLTDFSDPAARISLRDFDLFIETNEENPERPFGKFENASWTGKIPIRLYAVSESGELLLNKLSILFAENSVPDEIEFEGVAVMRLDGQEIRIRLYTERKNDRTYLFLNKDDILAAAEHFEDFDVSDQEAQLISNHPARALHILKITRDARRLSKREKMRNENFPDDAFKHIYWSYHLTRTFGPEFAKEITDAHETLPNNTPEQRAMDFNNNRIGRALASELYTIEELRNIVQNNPDVIRYAD